jgi:hypothetical protein
VAATGEACYYQKITSHGCLLWLGEWLPRDRTRGCLDRRCFLQPPSIRAPMTTQRGETSPPLDEIQSAHEYDGCTACKAKRKRAEELLSPSRRRARQQQIPTTASMLVAGLEYLGLSESGSFIDIESHGVTTQAEVHDHDHQVTMPDWLGRPLASEGQLEAFHSHDHHA